MRVSSVLATLLFGLIMVVATVMVPRTAQATVNIKVNLSTQTMQVTSNNGDTYVWPVSTARRGYRTPRGTYGVRRMAAMHYSKKYHNSPMPHSIFFRGGYAIHGTYATRSLGRAASHGCIRLAPQNAAVLYDMVKMEGARITIMGDAPRDTMVASAEHHRHHHPSTVATRSLEANPLSYAPLTPSFDDWTRDPTNGQ